MDSAELSWAGKFEGENSFTFARLAYVLSQIVGLPR